MNCHAQIWTDAAILEPIRASARDDVSIRWVKVHDLPDFVFFNHAIHVQNGIGCVSCHGRVDRMNQIWQESSLTMEWCLECHRHPEAHVRPREHVFDLAWKPPAGQPGLGAALARAYGVTPRTDCTTCHR
jgi:hypothetical protein